MKITPAHIRVLKRKIIDRLMDTPQGSQRQWLVSAFANITISETLCTADYVIMTTPDLLKGDKYD